MNEIDTEKIKPTVFYNLAQLQKKTGVGRKKLKNMLNGFMYFRVNAQNGRLMIKGEWFIEALEKPTYNAKKYAEYKEYLANKMKTKKNKKAA